MNIYTDITPAHAIAYSISQQRSDKYLENHNEVGLNELAKSYDKHANTAAPLQAVPASPADNRIDERQKSFNQQQTQNQTGSNNQQQNSWHEKNSNLTTDAYSSAANNINNIVPPNYQTPNNMYQQQMGQFQGQYGYNGYNMYQQPYMPPMPAGMYGMPFVTPQAMNMMANNQNVVSAAFAVNSPRVQSLVSSLSPNRVFTTYSKPPKTYAEHNTMLTRRQAKAGQFLDVLS